MNSVVRRKKLIEVALPLDAINKACSHEKMPGIGPHPRGLHQWWARRPLAAARAVLFAQMVDDPSSCPEQFPTEAQQVAERRRLFKVIEEVVKWENTTNDRVLRIAREEIRKSWRRTCEDNSEHQEAHDLFDPGSLPAFHDPFAGGGALPLEAQRLGLEAHASDLNPVAVLINKAMIEIPPKFAGRPPVNPEARSTKDLVGREWRAAQGLAEDVRYYGRWMRDQAEKRIGHIYPTIAVTEEMTQGRPDLKPYEGQELSAIAWLWARTVRSPNPAFADVEVPLVSSFMLSTKKGKQAYVEPMIQGDRYWFTVKSGDPPDLQKYRRGTKSGGSGSSFVCIVSGTPMPFAYLRREAYDGRMGMRLMAVVAQGNRSRVYLSPTAEMQKIACVDKPLSVATTRLPDKALGFRVQQYGMTRWCDLFTPRQLVALTTLSDLLNQVRDRIRKDAVVAGVADEGRPLRDGGTDAMSYAEATAIYLAFAVDRCCDFSNTVTRWVPGNQKVMSLFAKQAIAMTWDFPEAAILETTVGGFGPATTYIAKCIDTLPPATSSGRAVQLDAMVRSQAYGKVVSTDPPYYDNIGYADLSDFFYVWLRRTLKPIFPDLFGTLAVPKAGELVATPYRHGDTDKAEIFFLEGMKKAMSHLAEQTHPGFPVTIYYSFKQSETKRGVHTRSTGWEAFLEAVSQAGLSITGTWPVRTEQSVRAVGIGTNALASCIVLVCRRRSNDAGVATRREFVATLRTELPPALAHLQSGNIAPVDLAQAAIGPGMAVYTRYARVLDSQGQHLPVREALALINEVLDEVLSEQEGYFDPASRWAVGWFEEYGFEVGEFGVAETLSKAKNTSVGGLEQAGILESSDGQVRLLRPSELPTDWDPAAGTGLTAWEIVHHLIRVLECDGEMVAAGLVRRLGSVADVARDLSYRLYSISERSRRAPEALQYNGLVGSWSEIRRLAGVGAHDEQTGLFGSDDGGNPS